MTPEEKRAHHAAYMREYSARPGKREKKRASDRRYAAAHRVEASERAARIYYADQEGYQKRSRRRLYENKRNAVARLGGKCFECGCDHPAALHFHHRDPATKLFGLSTHFLGSKQKYTEELFEAEIAKCDLLCANCHAIEHNTWDEWIEADRIAGWYAD